MPNLWPRLAAALDPFAQTRLARRVQLGNWEIQEPVDPQRIAADLADHDETDEGLARAGDDEPAPRRLPERIEPSRQPDRRTEAPGDAALGQGNRDPAFGDVVGAAERARPHARPDGPVSDPDPPDVHRGQLPDRRTSEQLAEFGPDERGFERPDERDRIALVGKAEAAVTSATLEQSRADADFERAQTARDRTQKTYARQQTLVTQGATPRLTFEKAEAEYQSAVKEYEVMDAAVRACQSQLTTSR